MKGLTAISEPSEFGRPSEDGLAFPTRPKTDKVSGHGPLDQQQARDRAARAVACGLIYYLEVQPAGVSLLRGLLGEVRAGYVIIRATGLKGETVGYHVFASRSPRNCRMRALDDGEAVQRMSLWLQYRHAYELEFSR